MRRPSPADMDAASAEVKAAERELTPVG
jgi:hypothetical protein